MKYGAPPREHVTDLDRRRAELGGQVTRESRVRGGDSDDGGRMPVREIGAYLCPRGRAPARQPDVKRLEVLRGRAPVVDVTRSLPAPVGIDERAAA
ncbi:MAG TPA: hypothetical protein VJ351_10845, partial [Streptosporangiaceae bacterium]|nr:hypothetical protein [Streptosporangiaceae bacterium]